MHCNVIGTNGIEKKIVEEATIRKKEKFWHYILMQVTFICNVWTKYNSHTEKMYEA